MLISHFHFYLNAIQVSVTFMMCVINPFPKNINLYTDCFLFSDNFKFIMINWGGYYVRRFQLLPILQLLINTYPRKVANTAFRTSLSRLRFYPEYTVKLFTDVYTVWGYSVLRI